jgi:hypothetical protein
VPPPRRVVRDLDTEVLTRRESRRLDTELERARACGLSVPALRQLRCLVDERGRGAWQIGDALVSIYGVPPAPGVLDGSRRRMELLADELGCSLSWLTALRLTAAAWPSRERRAAVPWSVHRDLRTDPDRFVTLASFTARCGRDWVTPSVGRLAVWQAGRASTAARSARRSPTRSGRPKLDPVERVARQALALGRADLERLVVRLQAELDGAVVAA